MVLWLSSSAAANDAAETNDRYRKDNVLILALVLDTSNSFLSYRL